MNTEILLAAKAEILANPHAHVMSFYVIETTRMGFRNEAKEPEKNLCGTACCIAGTIVALHDQVNLVKAYPDEDMRSRIGDRAAEILGLGDDADAVPLFFRHEWPDSISARYSEAETDQERANAMAEAIDTYIASPQLFDVDDDDDDEDEDDYDHHGDFDDDDDDDFDDDGDEEDFF